VSAILHLAHAADRARRTLSAGFRIVAGALLLFVVAGPIDGLLFPVLDNQVTENVSVDANRVRWTWSVRKAREGAPVQFAFLTYVNGRGPYLLEPITTNLPPRPLTKGETFELRVELPLPDVGEPVKSVTVHPLGLYRAPLEPWLVPQTGSTVHWTADSTRQPVASTRKLVGVGGP